MRNISGNSFIILTYIILTFNSKKIFILLVHAYEMNENVTLVIRKLNFVYIYLILVVPHPPLDPRNTLGNELSPHTYTTYVKGIMGLEVCEGGGGGRVAQAKVDI